MKPLLFAVLAFACIALSADHSTSAQAPRYQVVSGPVEYSPGDVHPSFVRIDTWTGDAWFVNNLPVKVGERVAVTPFWQPIPEQDSDQVRELRK